MKKIFLFMIFGCFTSVAYAALEFGLTCENPRDSIRKVTFYALNSGAAEQITTKNNQVEEWNTLRQTDKSTTGYQYLLISSIPKMPSYLNVKKDYILHRETLRLFVTATIDGMSGTTEYSCKKMNNADETYSNQKMQFQSSQKSQNDEINKKNQQQLKRNQI